MNINIQSITDLITNSSTEVFIVYDNDNISSIKGIVNAIIGLYSSTDTFDDFFDIKMKVDYESLNSVFEKYEYKLDKEEFPEIYTWSSIPNYQEQWNYLNTIPESRAIKYIDYYNIEAWSDEQLSYYEGFSITPKSETSKEAAKILNRIDQIFHIDYRANY